MTEPPSAKEGLTARAPLGGSLSGSLIEESPRGSCGASGPTASGGPLSSLSALQWGEPQAARSPSSGSQGGARASSPGTSSSTTAALPTADPKPEKRIVDGTAEPYDRAPVDENFCAACERFTATWHCHHIVGRAQGGDDLPENLVWLCPSCHRILHDFPVNSLAARRIVRYARETVPELGAYADAKKFIGYVEWRYLGEKDLEPVA